MKIQYCSDLHLEFPQNAAWIQQNPIIPKADILIMAGDTHNLGRGFKEHPFFDVVSQQFKAVYIIPGNHEFYGGYDAEICLEKGYINEIRSNVFLVNNMVKIIDGVRFVFTTLWSKIEREIVPILRGMSDFHTIRCKGERLNINTYNELFSQCWAFLKEEISTPSKEKTIVITHHLPSWLCNLEKYKDSILNEAFCVNLTREIESCHADYWIYGHSHGNKPSFNIGNTEMLTNQLGYVHIGEHRSFENDKVIEI